MFQLQELKIQFGDVDENIDTGVKTTEILKKIDPLDLQRREKVKEAMLHAWTSYEKYAWGQDELQVSKFFCLLW